MCRLFAISAKKEMNVSRLSSSLLTYFSKSGNDDGTGLAYTKDGKIECIKSADPAIVFVFENSLNIKTNALIGHLRNATSGEVSNVNAHPFLSENNDIAMAHNGQLWGYTDMKTKLKEKGHKFTSDVDSEVVLHAYEDKKEKFIKALLANEVSGWINLAFLHKDGTINIYSDGNIYYYVFKDFVLVVQDEIFKNMTELKAGYIMTLKDGKIVSIDNIGKLETRYSSTNTARESNTNYTRVYRDQIDSRALEERLSQAFDISYMSVTILQLRNNMLTISIRNITPEQLKTLNMIFSCFSYNYAGKGDTQCVRGTIKKSKFLKKLENWTAELRAELFEQKQDSEDINII